VCASTERLNSKHCSGVAGICVVSTIFGTRES
jgi:hypothetical protein